ncbi:MAG TPA: AmmeMemoRadiSam system protein B, partial [Gemmataceae bacterium]|nr:AmmeMemoRadiSam system protein B [Gemmataceae bacterium]
LRPGLALVQDERDARFVVLCDRLRLSDRHQRLSWRELTWLQLFDGQRTLREIQIEAMRQEGGQLLPIDLFRALVDKLDNALFLESPRYRVFLASPIREPSCIGCYPEEPDGIRKQLEGLFTGPRGPGLPRRRLADGKLCGALIPHIDYQRGGSTYAWGFKEVFEGTAASLFVIIGTSHYSNHRFTLTRKDFRTPLGIARTDQDYIDRLVKHFGEGLFEDELAHLPEHSIELEVVFLQYLYENVRPIRIVPLVVGSFEDAVSAVASPGGLEDVCRMIAALRCAEAETPEPICYIISGDLAHIGPKFDDPEPVREPVLTQSRKQDQAILEKATALDIEAYFKIVADERDARRICGLPPTYTTLQAIQPRQGKLLHYDQYVHPRGYESVSFASVAFYR